MMEYKNKNNTEHLDKSELLNRHIKFQLSLRKRKLNELLMRYRMKDKEKTFKYRIDMNELKLNVNVVNISLGTDKELIDNLSSLLSSHNDHEVKYALLLCRKYSMIPQAPIQLMIKNNFTLMIVNVLMKYLYDVKVIYESLTILVNLTAEMNDEDKETSLCIMSNGMTLYNRIKNDNNLYDIFIMLISNILLLNKDNQLISKHDIVINIIDDIYSKKLYERVDMIRVINEIDNVDIEIIKKSFDVVYKMLFESKNKKIAKKIIEIMYTMINKRNNLISYLDDNVIISMIELLKEKRQLISPSFIAMIIDIIINDNRFIENDLSILNLIDIITQDYKESEITLNSIILLNDLLNLNSSLINEISSKTQFISTLISDKYLSQDSTTELLYLINSIITLLSPITMSKFIIDTQIDFYLVETEHNNNSKEIVDLCDTILRVIESKANFIEDEIVKEMIINILL